MAAGFPSMPGLPGLSRRGRSYGALMAGLRPTAFWRFNDRASNPSATTARDEMGTHHGSISGNPTSATGAITGDTNACFDFDGSSAAVVIPYSAALNAATFSITGRIYRDADTGSHEHIADTRSSSNVGWGFRVSDADKLLLVIGTGAGQIAATDTANCPTGRWVHVAATYDGTNARLYVDGALAGTSLSGAMSANTTAPVRIGVAPIYAGNQLYFNGKIDELTYHGGRVLTDAEILAQYRAGI